MWFLAAISGDELCIIVVCMLSCTHAIVATSSNSLKVQISVSTRVDIITSDALHWQLLRLAVTSVN
jgi:hypothetical protein